jgi:DegV family protein with EDD domain
MRDGVDMPADEFYTWLKDTRTWPKTANPSAGDYLEAFRRAAHRDSSVVAISISSAGSGGYQSAMLAKRLAQQELPGVEIEVIDTCQFALGHGWSVIQAARAAMKGLSLPAVAAVARETSLHSFIGFTNDTLEYLQRGGRLNRMTSRVGDFLNIKPLIGIRDGLPQSLGTARSRQAAYKKIVELAQQRVPAGRTIRAALMHVAAPDEVENFRHLLESQYSVMEWVVAQLSPALGVHSGPGTVGIAIIPDSPSH